MRWIVIALLSGFLNCNPNKPTPIPTPSATPESPVLFSQPKITFGTNGITIGFGSLLLPPNQIIEGIFELNLGSPKHIVRIWSFIGVDSGDLGEFAIDISTPDRIYQRSLHKETTGIYDAWANEDVDITVQVIKIHTLGHMIVKSGHLELELILETEP